MKITDSADLTEINENNFNNLELPTDIEERIIGKLKELNNYVPKIGILGKTGVGKSSLVNVLTGQNICEINNLEPCTRNPKEVLLKFASNKKIILLDVPGVGENNSRDMEYFDLYQNLLPELDLVLWLIKADDRAFTSDELFYNNIVKPHLQQGKPILFVLNQVDKIEPIREWDIKNNVPGYKQTLNINNKIEYVSRIFKVPTSKIISISVAEKYNLERLLDEMVFALPEERQYTFVKRVSNDIIRKQTMEIAENNTCNAIAGYVIDHYVRKRLTDAVDGFWGGSIWSTVKKFVVSVAKKLIKFFIK